jgi:hypothetical protein
MERTWELFLGIASVAMFVGMLLAVPWIVSRLPADHFVRERAKDALPRRIARNVLGAVLVLAGVAMLVLPGQGVLTILVGLSLVDFPLKRRLLCRLLRTGAIARGVQRLRSRAGRPPLLLPSPTRAG